jgi:hypothetical protein
VAEPLQRNNADDYKAQLAALGLKIDYFFDALRAGEEARRLCTENDPKSAAGTYDYFRRVRQLRYGLADGEEWKRADVDGLPLIVNPERTIALGVLLGDHKTGWPGPYHPRSRRPVGEKKIKLVAQNGQLSLFSRPVPTTEIDLESEDLSNCQTWFFVTYRRVWPQSVIVSSELSLPSLTGGAAYIERWSHRIPFPDVTFDSVVPHTSSDDDGTGEYDVAVDEK